MLRRLQKMLCAALIALLLISSATPALAKSVTAKVNSSSAKVYKKASRSSASAKLKKGTKVKVTAVSGSWAKVKLNGKTLTMGTDYKVTIERSMTVMGNTTTWTEELKNGTMITLAPGTHTCKMEFLGDYSGTKDVTLTVNKVPLSDVTVTLSDDTLVYNGGMQSPAIAAVTYKGYTLKEFSYASMFSSYDYILYHNFFIY